MIKVKTSGPGEGGKTRNLPLTETWNDWNLCGRVDGKSKDGIIQAKMGFLCMVLMAARHSKTCRRRTHKVTISITTCRKVSL